MDEEERLLLTEVACSTLAIVKRSGTIDEMARDEARHGKAFAGLLKRYFG